MGRQLKIEPHLTVDELGQKYRHATDAIERSHWQILWLLVQGSPTGEVAELTMVYQYLEVRA